MESPIIHEYCGPATTSASSSTATTSSASSSSSNKLQSAPGVIHRILPDKVNLRLILVSGKSKDFMFSPSDSAADIAQYVFDNWPLEWDVEAVQRAEILRLIYQGRFLHGNVTLGALQLPLGRTSVMHLVPRENLPEPNSQDQRQKSKERSSGCCSASCSVL